MSKSRARFLSELLASTGKVKESKSALDISGGKITLAELPTITNAKLDNSSMTLAGESVSLGGSQSFNTGHISEHTNYKYYTDARARASISAGTGISYNSSTGVITNTGTYGNSDVDSHLNQSDPTSGYVLSWNGSDYAWVSNAGYADSDVESYLDANGTTFPDNVKAQFGGSNDLRIFHNATNNVIQSVSGDLILQNEADDKDIILKSDDGSGGVTQYIRVDGSAGLTQFDKNTKYVDDIRATWGSGEDLQIYHNASESFIRDVGTGVLTLDTNGSEIRFISDGSYSNGKMARMIKDGAVELYHDNSLKLATASDGIDVTGMVSMTTGHSTGKFAVKNAGVHASYDFYNNGNSYFNGGVIVDDHLQVTGGSAQLTVNGNASITGNLTVSGTTTTLNTATLDVEDKNITLNYGSGDTSSSADGAGITIQDAVDSSTNATLLWTTADDRFNLSHPLSIVNNSTSTDTLYLESTEASSSAAPVVTFKRHSSSPADADYLGQLKFKGENDADQDVVYAKVTGKIQDASDGSEDGLIEFANRKAGSNVITARLRSDSLQLLNGTALSVNGNITVDGTVDGRDIAADGSKLDGIEASATADQTAAEILTAIKTVDGAGSGLDADTLDGISSASFLRSDASDSVTGGNSLTFFTSGGSERGFLQATDTNDEHFIIATSGGEDIGFKDGGLSGTTNMIIRGDGSMWLRGAISNGTIPWSQVTSKPSNLVDWTASGAGTIHASNYTDTNTTYSAGTGVTLSGTTFSIGQAVGTGNNVSFNRVAITEANGQLDLPSGGVIDWANGDARIIEGESENYSLSFKTYDGSSLTTALRLDGDNSAHFEAAIVEMSDMYFRPGNNTRNLRIQPNASSSDGGLTFFDGGGTWRAQFYWHSSAYGFLDANWGNWDIKKIPSGAMTIDVGSGLETVATQTWVNAQGFLTSGVSLSANNTFTGSNSFSNVYNEFGNGVGSVSNDGSWHGRVNIAGTNHGRLDVKANGDGIIGAIYAHDGHDGPRFGSLSNHPVDFMVNGSVKMRLDSNGKIYPGGDSSRGYIGPVGTHDISLHSVRDITFDWDGNYDHIAYHGLFSQNSAGTYTDSMALKSFDDITMMLDSNNNDSASYFRITNNVNDGSNVIGYIGFDGTQPIWSMPQSSTKLLFSGSSTTYGIGVQGHNYNTTYLDTCDSGGNSDVLELVYYSGAGVKVGASGGTKPIYASVFYDGNNTARYVDPAGSSQLHKLEMKDQITFPTSNGATTAEGGASYAIYQESGGWSSPFPELQIGFHTGINMGGHSSYNGTRIFTNSDMASQVMQFAGSANYIYKNVWMHTTTAGFYSSSGGGFHFQPSNTGSYGSADLIGSRGSYGGMLIEYGGTVIGMYDSGGNGGSYREANSKWRDYFHTSNACMGINGSTTSSSYGLYVTGAIYATGDIVGSSDERLKKNIQVIDNGLEKVLKLRGVTYEWKEEESTGVDENKSNNTNTTPVRMGVIAQELLDIVPEVVVHDKENDRYGVEYGHLTGLLIEAIKDLNAKVEDLEKKLEEK